MEVFLNEVYNYIIELINNSAIFGPIIAGLLIFVESILPVLPLFVFITIMFIACGYCIGFMLSYILTCLGCLFSFWLCRTILKKYFDRKVRKIERFNKIMLAIDKIKFTHLTLLIAIPFTPAFLVNIAASLSNMSYKKFLLAISIGKISLVAFWGFIGTSLLESLKNPKILIVIGCMLLITFIISKIVTKKINIE